MPLATKTHWTLDDIPWDAFDAAKVTPELLAVVGAAALVERNGADYGAYLGNVFADDPSFCAAAARWAQEEEQHGLALGRWAELASPRFKFDERFARFRDLYRIPVDATASVRGSRAGELCARCVVESGTSSFYSALRDAAAEPVLKAICARIAADEIRHYKLFYTHMQRYQARDGLSLFARLRVALGRVQEADDDELASAYFAANAPAPSYDRARDAKAYSERAFAFYRNHHTQRAGRMIAKAIGFKAGGWLERALQAGLWAVIGFRGRKFRALAA
ncbi:MAG: ferritin-like domain-containing protein [Rhodospirillaceae bacterium]|nr:ferritin-like domain-containing protein [Rhodospirillaceae bacterium]